MVSEWQEAAIGQVAFHARFGLIIGAICGGLVGTIVCLLRTRRASALLLGPFLSIIPSAVAASTAGILSAVVIAFGFPLHPREGFKVPDYGLMLTITLVLFVSAIVGIFAPRESDSAVGQVWRSIVWAVVGGAVWTAAHLHYHWVISTPATDLNDALFAGIADALTGAIVVGGWRLLAGQVIKKFGSQMAPTEHKSSPAAEGGESPWDKADDQK